MSPSQQIQHACANLQMANQPISNHSDTETDTFLLPTRFFKMTFFGTIPDRHQNKTR